MENFQKNNLSSKKARRKHLIDSSPVVTITKFRSNFQREREREIYFDEDILNVLTSFGGGGCLLRISCRIYLCAVSYKSVIIISLLWRKYNNNNNDEDNKTKRRIFLE